MENILEKIDPKILGNRLQESRRARGLKQQDVADQMNIARTTIVAIEKGERRVIPVICFLKFSGQFFLKCFPFFHLFRPKFTRLSFLY